MTPLPWFYVYSERYEAMHYMLHSHIYKDPDFRVHPIKVDQSEFAKTTYLESNTHFLAGCFIKQATILQILKQLPTDSYFIFTDVDILVFNTNGLREMFQSYMDKGCDMVYSWENSDQDIPIKNYNIGISLIRVNEKTIKFFERFMEKSRTSVNTLDQNLLCSLLPEFPGTLGVFDKHVVTMSNFLNDLETTSKIKILQTLCSNHKDYHLNMQEKYMCMQNLGAPIQQCIELALQNGRSLDELGLYE
jgi:hypothetical protein